MNIIFDLDGTLWDSSETILKAWKVIFKKEMISITLDEIKRILGLTNEEIINWLFLNKNINKIKAKKILCMCQKEEIDQILKLHRAVVDGLKFTLVEKEVSSNDIMYISHKMPQVLFYNDEK